MSAECHVCGEGYASNDHFAAPGVCQTCFGQGGRARFKAAGTARAPPRLFQRRFWLSAGALFFLFGTLLAAVLQFALAFGGTLFFGAPGSGEGAVIFILGLFNVIVILVVGLSTSAIFFTLRAWDERFESQDAAATADLST